VAEYERRLVRGDFQLPIDAAMVRPANRPRQPRKRLTQPKRSAANRNRRGQPNRASQLTRARTERASQTDRAMSTGTECEVRLSRRAANRTGRVQPNRASQPNGEFNRTERVNRNRREAKPEPSEAASLAADGFVVHATQRIPRCNWLSSKDEENGTLRERR